MLSGSTALILGTVLTTVAGAVTAKTWAGVVDGDGKLAWNPADPVGRELVGLSPTGTLYLLTGSPVSRFESSLTRRGFVGSNCPHGSCE